KESRDMGYDWGGVKDADIFGRGRYLKDGKYKLKLLKMFTYETRNKGAALIVDFEVMDSDNDEIAVGSKRNWWQGLSDKDIAFPAVKEFMISLFNVNLSDPEEEKQFSEELPEVLEKATDEKWKDKPDDEHPLHGMTIAVECYTKQTVKKKVDFTVHDWEPWEPDDE